MNESNQPKTAARCTETARSEPTEKVKPGRYLPKKRKSEKKLRYAVLVCSTLILLFSLIMLITKISRHGDCLQGMWDFDGTTVYYFDGFGNGSLILPDNTYEFAYTITGEQDLLSIDFLDDIAIDQNYNFSVAGSQLSLTESQSKNPQRYVFTIINNE